MTTDSPRPPAATWADLLGVALGQDPEPLRRYLAGALAARACSRTLRETRRWAIDRVPWDPLERGLRALGARCDCEALEIVSRGCSC